MLLQIFVDSHDTELINKYSKTIEEHNIKINNTNHIDTLDLIYITLKQNDLHQ
jgi:hypothetical protein